VKCLAVFFIFHSAADESFRRQLSCETLALQLPTFGFSNCLLTCLLTEPILDKGKVNGISAVNL